MSSSKTDRYQLHQWQPQDEVKRTEFNENFALIEGAVVAGSYVGDGQERRFIALPFTPTAVFVISSDGECSFNHVGHGGLALTGNPLRKGLAEVAEGGFYVVMGKDYDTINSGGKFYYLAFR